MLYSHPAKQILKWTVIKDKEKHYIEIKGSSQHEDIIFINIYASNIRTPKYLKQILVDIKGGVDSNTITLGDFDTHLHQKNPDHLDRKHWL